VFELWDTRNARLVGTFPSESDALDAAYRELRVRAQHEGPQSAPRPHLAVSSAAPASASTDPRGRLTHLPGALRRAIAPVRALALLFV